MFNNPFFQKLNLIADWILRIVTINLFLVFATVLIVPFYPALYAAFKLFRDWTSGKHTPIFDGFWGYFKENFKQKLFVGLIFVAVLLVAVLSLNSYNDYIKADDKLIYLIGYYVVLLCLIMFILVTLYTVLILIYFKDISLSNVYKLSLYVLAKYFYITFVVSFLWLIPVLLVYISIYYLNQLFVVFVIAGFSLTVLFWALISKPALRFLENLSTNVNKQIKNNQQK